MYVGYRKLYLSQIIKEWLNGYSKGWNIENPNCFSFSQQPVICRGDQSQGVDFPLNKSHRWNLCSKLKSDCFILQIMKENWRYKNNCSKI